MPVARAVARCSGSAMVSPSSSTARERLTTRTVRAGTSASAAPPASSSSGEKRGMSAPAAPACSASASRWHSLRRPRASYATTSETTMATAPPATRTHPRGVSEMTVRRPSRKDTGHTIIRRKNCSLTSAQWKKR